ncbi:hypothetical protein K5Q02_11425 [Pseudomonas sp. MM211]|nr:hypothetical protein [Pseudomonas sp. MM211]UCJ18927.1 hypothetical protein K5Q02_11425 [Pseudomonas sp. MM211]
MHRRSRDPAANGGDNADAQDGYQRIRAKVDAPTNVVPDAPLAGASIL